MRYYNIFPAISAVLLGSSMLLIAPSTGFAESRDIASILSMKKVKERPLAPLPSAMARWALTLL